MCFCDFEGAHACPHRTALRRDSKRAAIADVNDVRVAFIQSGFLIRLLGFPLGQHLQLLLLHEFWAVFLHDPAPASLLACSTSGCL